MDDAVRELVELIREGTSAGLEIAEGALPQLAAQAHAYGAALMVVGIIATALSAGAVLTGWLASRAGNYDAGDIWMTAGLTAFVLFTAAVTCIGHGIMPCFAPYLYLLKLVG